MNWFDFGGPRSKVNFTDFDLLFSKLAQKIIYRRIDIELKKKNKSLQKFIRSGFTMNKST